MTGPEAFDVDGHPLAYADAGAGTPLLLIRGSPIDGRAWARRSPAFAAEEHRTLTDRKSNATTRRPEHCSAR